ncbi:hypothetical protein Scep_006941 [Stephania cephalantha]|uniref:Uncharacterized protein n=1 Tax=Stephania cephalantha TaxID=152367 RepID=A0AAP0KAJ1_9MAGN
MARLRLLDYKWIKLLKFLKFLLDSSSKKEIKEIEEKRKNSKIVYCKTVPAISQRFGITLGIAT